MDKIVDFLLNFSGVTPYCVVFGVLLICGLGLPIPEDIILFAAGLASYYGLIQVFWICIVAYFGVIFGDGIIFYLGSSYGRKLTQKWIFSKMFSEQRLDMMSKKLNKQGNKLIFFARFMPGLRAPIFFTAGMLHIPFRVFFLYDGLAALISVPLIIGAVFYFGDELDHVVHVIQKIEHGIFLIVFAVVLVTVVKFYLHRRSLRKI